jgi:hypothetical protein
VSHEGAVRFARYAYPPNALGYCGPAGAEVMLEPTMTAEIVRRARQFEGAWSYLEFLAETLGDDDPLSSEVVEAYWVGGELLDRVDPGKLVTRLEQRFLGQVGGTWREASARATAHHSFQVFEVYPWVGLLKLGRAPGPAVNVLDRCRIRVGEVLAVRGEQVVVTSRPLVWDGTGLREGDRVPETARWSHAGAALIGEPRVGDLVALHWDWVCEVLAPGQVRAIEERERRQRAAVGLHASG